MDFSLLWEESFPTLSRHAHRLARHKQDAEDLVSETSLRLIGAFASFDQTKPFLNWALKTMTRLWLDEIRDRKRRPTCVNLDEAWSVAISASPNAELDQILENLDNTDRLIVELTAQGFSAREIGEKLGIPGRRVHSQLASLRDAANRRYLS